MNTLNSAPGALIQDPAFALTFRLRQPANKPFRACVILLHGVGGNETNLFDLVADLAPDILVIAARAPLTLAPGQFAWFNVSFGSNGPSIDAKQAEQSRQQLDQFVKQCQQTYGIAPERTIIAGFSQGGIMSASLALTSPERVAGFGLLSGRILPEIEPHLASRSALSPLRAFVAHGEYDSKLPVSWAQRSDEWLTQLGVSHISRRYPIDHGISAAMAHDFLAWLETLIANEAN